MNTMDRRSLLAALALTSLTAGCFSRPPAELTAAEIMAKASNAMRNVKSIHFKLTSTGGMMAIGTGMAARSIEGDVVRPDRLRGTAVSTFGKLTVDLGFMVIGTHQYVTNPITKKWEEMPAQANAPNLLDPDHGATAILKQVSDLKRLADESIDGVDCYHVAGKIGASLIAGLVGAPGTSNTLSGDVWVGTKDFLVRRIRLVGAVASNEPNAIQRVLDLSNFNETISIEPPS